MRSRASRRHRIILIFSAALAGFLAGGSAKDADRDSALIKQLGDRRFASRKKAGEALKDRGAAALPALQKAARDHPDLEVRQRATQLIRRIVRATAKSKSTGLELMVVAPGAFQMGSAANAPNRRDDESQHGVRITRALLLGKHEVTQEQYRTVMKTNPSSFSMQGKYKAKVGNNNTDRFPVDSVTWHDAVEFCNRLSKLDGYEPYYKVNKEKGKAMPTVTRVGGNGYRLPTEAEWEHACRGWTVTPFHFGKTNTGREANIKATTTAGMYGSTSRWKDLKRTTTVGSYPANGWGLHDVHGNVAEWCWDWYDKDYYAKSPVDDPDGPTSGTHRTLRGGSWLVNERSCRSAARFMLPPDQATYYAGFRVARTP